MAFRRELDTQAGTENVIRLLREMRDRPSVISRARLRATWSETKPDYAWNANRAFNAYPHVEHADGPHQDHVEPGADAAGLVVLEEQDRVLQHVQTTVAHRMPHLQVASVPTVAEFHAAIESFNGRFREECLNVHWFPSLSDAQEKIDAFRWDYSEHHPHRALKGLSPREYAQRAMTTAAESPAWWFRKTRSPQSVLFSSNHWSEESQQVSVSSRCHAGVLARTVRQPAGTGLVDSQWMSGQRRGYSLASAPSPAMPMSGSSSAVSG